MKYKKLFVYGLLFIAMLLATWYFEGNRNKSSNLNNNLNLNNNGEIKQNRAQTDTDCDTNYSSCIPSVDYDLDCSDIGTSVTVIGEDVHGFDADDDGEGCELNN